MFSRVVRGHWAVESMYWQLDVTFKKDANTTLDKTVTQNQNIIRKRCLGMLKMIEIRGTKMSLRQKRFNISFTPGQFIEELLKIKKTNLVRKSLICINIFCSGQAFL